MQIQHCFTGQRVVDKENGKLATIRRIFGSSGEVELAFDNGSTVRTHARVVEPAEANADAEAGPMRPCPQCAAKMPVAATVCPSCGFKYRVRQARSFPAVGKILVILIGFAVAAYAVWKYVLHEKLP